MTATANTSFTPAANTCVAPSGANFTGWLVSGTSDIKQPGTAFTWEYDEDKTFTALWSCYWNSDETACVTGYKITLSISNSSCRNPTYPMEPTILYTIPTRGAYLDEARTLLMTKTDNPIQLAHLEFMIHFDTNAPLNPEHSIQYSVPSVPSENIGNYRYGCPAAMNPAGSIYAGHGYTSATCFIHNNPDNYTYWLISGLTPNNRDGYLTDEGIYEAENQYTNQNWVVSGCGWSSSPSITSPSLTGYTFVNWCTDPLNTTYCFRGRVPADVQEGTYYAHWTPNTYDVVYNPGAHAASGSTAYTDTDGATYDSPYNTLSFAATPVSNNMSADTGYVFVGWTTDSTPTFTNGNLNNQYTGDTYWKRTSAFSLYAAYDCDTANGYQWNTNHTACENLYTVTYNCGSNGTGSPSSQSVNPQTSTSVTFHNASVCTPNSGYEFWYWNCVSNVYNSVQTTMPGITRYISGDETCTAIYREPCPNSGRRVNLLAGLGGPSVTDAGIASADSHDISFESNNLGTLTTEGMCAGNSGTRFLPGIPTGSGNYCWCHMASFTPTGGTSVNLSSYSNWVYISEITDCSEMGCDVLCNRYIISSPSNGTVLNQSLYEACVYDLNYTCGSASGSVSTPSQQTNIPYNMTETWASGVSGCSQSSALLQGWNCHKTGNVSTTTQVTSANNTYSITMPNYHVTCDAQWPNIYTVDFANCNQVGQQNPAQQNTVTNGNPMTLPSSCNGTVSTDEYDFRGWMCVNSDGQITFVNSSPYSYSVQSNTTCYAIWDIAKPCAPGITEHYVLEQQEENITAGAWNDGTLEELWISRATSDDASTSMVTFGDYPSGGYKVGLNTMCSQTSGIPGMPATSTLSDTNDENCWCQVKTVNGEPLEGEYPWVFAGSVSDCQSNCFKECFLWMMGEHGVDAMSLFLQSLYTRNVCKYNLRYTCGTGSSGNVSPTSGFNYESGVQVNLYQSGQPGEFQDTPSLSGCSYSNNYSLRGWNCHESGQSNQINNEYTISSMPANNVICDASWGYQLKYDCGAGTGNQWVAGTYNVGTTQNISTLTGAQTSSHCTAPTGYEANVYKWDCGGNNTDVTPGNSITISDNTTCIAQWARVCTITLNPSNGVTGYGGGDSSSSANNIKTIYSRYGDGAYKTNTNGVLSNKMTSQSGLADTPPSPALGIPVGRYVTITFDAQTPAPTNPVTGNQYSVTNPNNSVVQRGFAGYYSIQSSSWDPTQPYIDADGYITSYGQSAAENINPNNDSCPTWYAHYTCPTIFLPYVNLDGYTLMRWRTSNGSISLSMDRYLQGRNEPLCVDADLNAIWQANTYTIQYVLNGGTYGTNHPTSATYDSEFTVSNPTRTGYTFAGWTITGMDGITHYYSDNPIISNGVYQSSTTQTTTNTQLAGITDTHFMNLRSISGTVTFTAQWTQTQYTITYTCGDAGGTMSSNTNTVNTGQASYTVKPNVTGCDSYNGYHFTGWLCTPDLATGTGTATYSNTYPTNPDVSKTIATIGLSGNATCVAQWGQNIVNLLWNDNGATTAHSGTQSDSCLYGPGDITIPTTPPARTGYSFSGWKVTDWWHRLLDRFVGSFNGWCRFWKGNGFTGRSGGCDSLVNSAGVDTWGMAYTNNNATGIIIGTATCSNQSTALYATGNPGTTNGEYCWCRVISYTRGDISEQYTDLPWVYAYDFSSDQSNCYSANGCLNKCSAILSDGNTTFQNALFGR